MTTDPQRPDAVGAWPVFQAIEPVSAVSAVARNLLELFTSGSVPAGTRLPAERQLAAQLGVGRSAIREALAALEILGIVSVRPGSGTYLKGTTSELLPQTLSWGVMLASPETHELLEVRAGLEIQVAGLAASNATSEQLSELSTTVEAMSEHLENYDQFVAADMLFHQVLASAAGNRLLADLLTTVRSLLRVWVERAVRDAANTHLTVTEHQAILAAVIARDAAGAGAAMEAHMASARTRLLTCLHDGGD